MSRWLHPTIQSHSKIPGCPWWQKFTVHNTLWEQPTSGLVLLLWPFLQFSVYNKKYYWRYLKIGWEFETLKLCFRYQNTEMFYTNIGFHHWLFEIYRSKLLQNILFMVWMIYEPFLVIKSMNSVYNSCRVMGTNKVTLCCEQI